MRALRACLLAVWALAAVGSVAHAQDYKTVNKPGTMSANVNTKDDKNAPLKFKKGEKVTVVYARDDWMWVQNKAGKGGWVLRKEVTVADGGGSAAPAPSAEDKKKDADAKKQAAEEARRKKEEAANAKKQAAEEAKRKKEEAANAKKLAAEEAKRKKEEEAAAKKAAADEAKRKKDEEAAAKKAEEDKKLAAAPVAQPAQQPAVQPVTTAAQPAQQPTAQPANNANAQPTPAAQPVVAAQPQPAAQPATRTEPDAPAQQPTPKPLIALVRPEPAPAPAPARISMQPGFLSVRASEPGATVLLDGREVGTAPLRLQVEGGRHQVSIQKKDFTPAIQEVEVNGNEAPVSLALAPTPEAVKSHRMGVFAKWGIGLGVMAAGGLGAVLFSVVGLSGAVLWVVANTAVVNTQAKVDYGDPLSAALAPVLGNAAFPVVGAAVALAGPLLALALAGAGALGGAALLLTAGDPGRYSAYQE